MHGYDGADVDMRSASFWDFGFEHDTSTRDAGMQRRLRLRFSSGFLLFFARTCFLNRDEHPRLYHHYDTAPYISCPFLFFVVWPLFWLLLLIYIRIRGKRNQWDFWLWLVREEVGEELHRV